jgi:hypothetical protein
MESKPKLWLPTLIFLVLLSGGCSKNHSYTGKATIVGPDYRQGPCQGGVYINIDGHPNRHDPNGNFDIGDIPASFGLDTMNDVHDFPVRVLLDWKINKFCDSNRVDITRIIRAGD